MSDEFEDRKHTRHLNKEGASSPMPSRRTGPLDQVVPWVIEFRVVGTHHIIKAEVKEQMVIGRRDEKNGVFPDIDLSEYAAQALGVSRKHAMIIVRQNRVVIQDMNSPNGTYINNHVLNGGQEYRLRNGDQLRFGRLQLQIHFVVKPTSHDNTQELTSIEDLNIPQMGNGELVLVVDDDAQVANLMQMILEYAGFKTVVTNSVTDAITAMHKQMPRAIITELLLPDQSGIELVHYARENVPQDGNIPVMAVSTATAGFQMGQAIERGVDMFLGKPFAIDEFVRGMSKLVEQMR